MQENRELDEIRRRNKQRSCVGSDRESRLHMWVGVCLRQCGRTSERHGHCYFGYNIYPYTQRIQREKKEEREREKDVYFREVFA